MSRHAHAHTHPCAVPACTARVECDGEAVVETVEDGIKSGYLTCEERGQTDWLCDEHEDAVRCDYCGDWHRTDECDELAETLADHRERMADTHYEHAREQ